MGPAIESTSTIVLRLLRRLGYGVVALVVIAYLGICLMLHQQQRSRIYFPTRHTAVELPEVRFATPAGSARGWVVNPGKAQAVLYFGGNGEAVARNAEFFRAQLPGRTIYLVPYRGYDGNAGAPTEEGLYADALAEFDQVRLRHDSVALIGRSLGTGVATYVASKRPVERLVLVTPYDSLQNVAQAKFPWIPIAWLLEDKFESWRRAPALTIPVTLLVAAQDRLIPPSHAQKLAKAFPAAPTLVMIEGAGHNDISTKAAYAAAMQAAFPPPASAGARMLRPCPSQVAAKNGCHGATPGLPVAP